MGDDVESQSAASVSTVERSALAGRNLEWANNPPELWEEHVKATGGKVRTRFPPEPNGYLHIGHAKSMNMNFELAFEKLGVPPEKRETIFRYDDTNPEAESQEYIQGLAENVKWMGWKPVKTTYSSEYFEELYELAIKLIKNGKAYVCHQSGEEIQKCREIARAKVTNPEAPGDPNSPWRDRTVEENLKMFEDMRKGKVGEGEASLRMKMDMTSPNPNMWDTVAYRIKFVPHPHIGDKWCIYPTYDYTHCIIDSLEHIDYSICTLEFETRRESYYWLLKELDLYRPKVYEFSRLNLTYTMMSKRRLLKLVKDNFVRGWDDPRMPTINGLRRRGYTPEILNAFCRDIGVTRNDNVVEMQRLEHWARQTLHSVAKRAMAVLKPLKVIVTNYPEDKVEKIQVPDFPFDPEKGSHSVTLSRTLFIDESDFKENDDPDFFGLSPGKEVNLKYIFNVTCTNVVKDKAGKIAEVHVEADFDRKNKPKGNLTWVAATGKGGLPHGATIRLYEHLFTAEMPGSNKEVPWEEELNKTSEQVIDTAFVDESVFSEQPGTSIQFERLGFFVVDKESTSKKPVFNRTVSLKESGPKKAESGAQQARSRKEEQARQLAEKMAKMSLDPKDMFKGESDKYSKFDENGIPTHDAAGEPLSKSTIKKLKKDWDKQKKLFDKASAEKK